MRKSELVCVVGLLSSQSKAHGIAASDQNFVDICRYRSPLRLSKTQVQAVRTSSEPLPLHLRIGLYALKHSLLAWRASADVSHDLVISVSQGLPPRSSVGQFICHF